MLNNLKFLTEYGKWLIKYLDTAKPHSVSDLGSYNTIFLCSRFHGQYLLHTNQLKHSHENFNPFVSHTVFIKHSQCAVIR